jgi:hypothetical protein
MTLLTPKQVTIRANTGITVGQDFTRLEHETRMEVTAEGRGNYYGSIPGIPNHPRSFMRAHKVFIEVPIPFTMPDKNKDAC